jgi:DNA modification methylase
MSSENTYPASIKKPFPIKSKGSLPLGTSSNKLKATKNPKPKIITGDVIKVLKKLPKNNKFEVIIADPPYNIRKDFGNNIDYRELQNYINWSKN